MKIGSAIKVLRVCQFLTQEQLSTFTGLDIAKIETNTIYVSLDQLETIAKGLGCTIDRIYEAVDMLGEYEDYSSEEMSQALLDAQNKIKDLLKHHESN